MLLPSGQIPAVRELSVCLGRKETQNETSSQHAVSPGSILQYHFIFRVLQGGLIVENPEEEQKRNAVGVP